jgi:hypothetical protein
MLLFLICFFGLCFLGFLRHHGTRWNGHGGWINRWHRDATDLLGSLALVLDRVVDSCHDRRLDRRALDIQPALDERAAGQNA